MKLIILLLFVGMIPTLLRTLELLDHIGGRFLDN